MPTTPTTPAAAPRPSSAELRRQKARLETIDRRARRVAAASTRGRGVDKRHVAFKMQGLRAQCACPQKRYLATFAAAGRFPCTRRDDGAATRRERKSPRYRRRIGDVDLAGGGRCPAPEDVRAAFEAGENLPLRDALVLIQSAHAALAREGNVLRLEAPLMLVGDLHGQFGDLLALSHGRPARAAI